MFQDKKYKRSVRPFIVLAILLFYTNLYSQVNPVSDTLNHLNPDESLDPQRISTFPLFDFFPDQADTILTKGKYIYGYSPRFYDSLRVKASRKLITRKLYDVLVVSHEPSSKKEISGSSQSAFLMFSGKRIHSIEIRRLSVFGSSINMPLSSNQTRLEKILNATHVNTNEHIIRKNLLFSEGDTLSPLVLSDNERILRQLPFIDDSRIIVMPLSETEVDVVIVTKDIYSLGASYKYSSVNKGSGSIFDKNIFGIGHELKINVAYNFDLPESPAFGVDYNINNVSRSFTNLGLYYYAGLGIKTYGFNTERKLVSATTKYSLGISVRKMYTTEDLDTLQIPAPLKYNLQDYWLLRSFLVDKKSVTRLIFGVRFTNNDVWNRPFILPESYHYLQKYWMMLGAVSLTTQKFYKTNLIYGYGRTEDIPYGGVISLTIGKENSEFKERIYTGALLSFGQSIKTIGYVNITAGAGTYFNNSLTEQGTIILRASVISNLFYMGRYRIRNFVKADYTRGFDRYYDEMLRFKYADGFTGFRNDSAGGRQRLTINLESVIFSPVNLYGFRFAFFGFADLGYLFGTNEFVQQGEVLSGIGVGIRIRNDNLVFNTFQLRLTYFPALPDYSRANYVLLSGEQLLRPKSFDPGPPAIVPYD